MDKVTIDYQTASTAYMLLLVYAGESPFGRYKSALLDLRNAVASVTGGNAESTEAEYKAAALRINS